MNYKSYLKYLSGIPTAIFLLYLTWPNLSVLILGKPACYKAFEMPRLCGGMSTKRSETDMLNDISGVWRAVSDNTMLTINYKDNALLFAMGDKSLPVTIGAIDTDNRTINLNVITKTGKPVIWTLREIIVKEKTNEIGFHFELTLNEGQHDILEFVRKISADDLAAFNSNYSVKTEIATAAQPDLKRDIHAEESLDIQLVNTSPIIVSPINFFAFKDKHPSSIASSGQLSPALRRLMGKDFELLLSNIEVASDVDIEPSGHEVFGTGMAPQSAGDQAGAYAVDQSGLLYAVLLDKATKPRFRIFGATAYDALPMKLRGFISSNRT